MTVLKLGSLFDGIGVFPLAAVHCGMEPVWASEIEARPISITKRHFPDMLHLGDITKISGAEIPPVDVITFGSPCQDLSQIGTRNGFAGKKSSLFYQAMRIIEEMRYATNGRYPAFCIWENVAGAFSSNDRLDFAAMLSALQVPRFQCLLVDGHTPEWCEGDALIPLGDCWTPSIGENPPSYSGASACSSWQILQASVPEKYYLSPGLCSRFLRLAVRGLSATQRGGVPAAQTGRQVPIVRPFSLRRMRTMAQVGDQKGFCASFGRGGEPFPTLLASVTAPFSFWYEGEERDGFLRALTPLECERLMGLPENWTKYGCKDEEISDHARYRALGNSIALPCAEYVMAGIAEVMN